MPFLRDSSGADAGPVHPEAAALALALAVRQAARAPELGAMTTVVPGNLIGGEAAEGLPLLPWRADSVKRKRKKKMNKHLHRKRRKLQRHKK